MGFTPEQLDEFLKGGNVLEVQSDLVGGPTEQLERRARQSQRGIRENEALMKTFGKEVPKAPDRGPSFLARLFNALAWPGNKTREMIFGTESFVPFAQRALGGRPDIPPLDIPLPYAPSMKTGAGVDIVPGLFGDKLVPSTGTKVGESGIPPRKPIWEQLTEGWEQNMAEGRGPMPPRLGNILGAAGGMGIDLAFDPLSYVGLGPEVAASRGGGRALVGLKPKGIFSGPTETIPIVKGQPVQDAIGSAMNKIGETSVGGAVGRALIPGFGLPKNFKNLNEETRRKIISSKLDVDEMVDNMFNTLNQDELKYAALATEFPELLLSKDLVGAVNSRGGTAKSLTELKKQLNTNNVDLLKVQDAVNKYSVMRSNYQTLLRQNGLKKDVEQKLPQYFEKGQPKKEFKDPVEAMEAGFSPELDISKVSKKYAFDTDRRMLKDQFIGDSLKLYGEKLRPQDPLHIEQLNSGQYRILRDHIVPNDIYSALVKTDRVFGDEQAANAFLKFYDGAQNWWKGNVTVTTPGFHIRNSMGNAWNMWLAGVNNPKRFQEAGEIVGGATGRFANTVYQKEDLLRMAREYGVYKPEGAFMAEITGAKDIPARTGQLVNPFSTRFAPIEGGRVVGSAVENNARVALFLDRIVKGDTPQNAANVVKKYLFDYSELTPIEQEVFKRFVPFYTWMRKNTALQAEHLLTAPGKYNALGHLLGADSDTQSKQFPYDMRPKFSREGKTVALPLKVEGLPTLGTFDLPTSDLDFKGDVVSPFSPLIKNAYDLSSYLYSKTGARSPGGGFGEQKAHIPAPELVNQVLQALPEDMRKQADVEMVKSFITGKPVPGLDPRIKSVLVNSMPLLSKLARVSPTEENLANPAYVGNVTSTMTGVRVEPVDVRRQKALNTLERKRQLEEQLKIWFKEGQIDAQQYGFARRFLRGR